MLVLASVACVHGIYLVHMQMEETDFLNSPGTLFIVAHLCSVHVCIQHQLLP